MIEFIWPTKPQILPGHLQKMFADPSPGQEAIPVKKNSQVPGIFRCSCLGDHLTSAAVCVSPGGSHSMPLLGAGKEQGKR